MFESLFIHWCYSTSENWIQWYDWDVATTFAFLQKHGLTAAIMNWRKHRLMGCLGILIQTLGILKFLGMGRRAVHADIAVAILVTSSVVKIGGLAPGGINFDAKLRRVSTDVEDMFLAHISEVDTLARGLHNVAKLIEDGSLDDLVLKRCQSFDSETGALIEAGKGDFETLEKKVLEWGEPIVPCKWDDSLGVLSICALMIVD